MVPQVKKVPPQAKAARVVLDLVLATKLPVKAKLGIYKDYIWSYLIYAIPA